jgi:hypothetical protein
MSIKRILRLLALAGLRETILWLQFSAPFLSFAAKLSVACSTRAACEDRRWFMISASKIRVQGLQVLQQRRRGQRCTAGVQDVVETIKDAITPNKLNIANNVTELIGNLLLRWFAIS